MPTDRPSSASFVPSSRAPPTGRQDVSNPGRLSRYTGAIQARKNADLKSQVEKLTAQVAALEARFAAQAAAVGGEPTSAEVSAQATGIAELSSSLATLAEQATDNAAPVVEDVVTTSGEYGAGKTRTVPYRYVRGPSDTASMVSWSADAFGKSKTPGWYHTARHGLYLQRATAASTEPAGCFVSHSKYADEAARISNTGRLAF